MTLATDELFAALSDPTRRSIYERLSQRGEQTVHALTDQAGVSQPAVSKHLGVLKQAGLVRSRRLGREAYYRVEPVGLRPLVDWISHYSSFWSDHLDRLENLLDRMDQ